MNEVNKALYAGSFPMNEVNKALYAALCMLRDEPENGCQAGAFAGT